MRAHFITGFKMPKYQDKPLPVFAAVNGVVWAPEMPHPDHLLFTATMKRMKMAKFGVVSVNAHANGKNFCTGELTFSFLDV